MSFTTSDLRAWISEQTGLDVDLLDRPWFEPFMHQRLAHHGLQPTAECFRNLLRDHVDEMQQVTQQVAVPETWFFRYPAAFDYLADYLRQLRAEAGSTPLRMLSVACATGEEPFSMAIAAAHAQWPIDQIQIDALDWDEQCLSDASQLKFSQRAVREDLPRWAQPWMQLRNERIEINHQVAERINWRHADVVASPASVLHGQYQVIFCRNLLVYLNRRARQELILRLSRCLMQDGRLFVGHADAFDLVRRKFDAISAASAFVYRHAAGEPKRRLRTDGPAATPPAPKCRPRVVPPKPREDKVPDSASETTAAIVDDVDPMQVEPSLDDARRLADEGQLQDALAMTEVISDNHDPDNFALRGSILMALDRVEEAKLALRKALYLDPAHAETLLQLAVLYQQLGDADLAARYRRRAANSDRDTNDSRDS